MDYATVNSMAARICGIKPVSTAYRGEMIDITFQGVDLVAEIDYEGCLEGIKSPDGSDIYCAFQEWAIAEIERLVEKAIKQAKFDNEMDRAADRAESEAA